MNYFDTNSQYLCPICSRPEVASDVRSSSFVRQQYIADTVAKFDDPLLSLFREMANVVPDVVVEELGSGCSRNMVILGQTVFELCDFRTNRRQTAETSLIVGCCCYLFVVHHKVTGPHNSRTIWHGNQQVAQGHSDRPSLQSYRIWRHWLASCCPTNTSLKTLGCVERPYISEHFWKVHNIRRTEYAKYAIVLHDELCENYNSM